MTSISAWQLLVLNLPGTNITPRMRVWRALKAQGAAVLRDGVYLLPRAASTEAAFEAQAQEVERAGGRAYLLHVMAGDAEALAFTTLFDRSGEYAEFLSLCRDLNRRAAREPPAELARALAKLKRSFEAVAGIDYFPGKAQDQARAALVELEQVIAARLSPDEPKAVTRAVSRLDRRRFQGKRWATRRHLWIDRAASAWLIRRYIDPEARFVWLADPKDCPKRALGFDFDGAAFTHVGERVSFEVLAASFGLDADPALVRLGALVRYLDVGGIPVPEAAGLETLMKGARLAHPKDDDALLAAVTPSFDLLYAAYSESLA